MGDKSEAPPAPSYDKVSKASKKATKLAQKQAKKQNERADEQFDWATAEHAENKAVTGEVVGTQLDVMDDNSEYAREDRERYETVFQPLENDLVKEAMDYASPERMDLEMGRAQADVAQKYDQARAAAERQLEGYGINPAATRYAALDLGIRAQQAAAQAAAANQAAQQVEATRRALRTEAIGIGGDTADRVLAEDKLAVDAGSAANVNQNLTSKTGADIMGTAVDYGALASSALGIQTQGAGDIGSQMNTAYGNQLAAYSAEQEANTSWGELAGMALGAGAKVASSYVGAPVPAAAGGGAIPAGPTVGGTVPASASPSKGQGTDDVNAKLTAGEFVIPVDVVRWKGEEFFQKMIEGSRVKKDEAGAKPSMTGIPTGGPTFQSRPSALPAR